jgi:hypothetical protein
MRLTLITSAFLFPGVVVAQVVSQNASISPEGEKRVVRHVMLKDERGADVLVEQHLIEIDNGDYLYLPASQPQATKELEERICASMGSHVSKSAISRWSPETLGGGTCRDDHPVDIPDVAQPQAGALFINAIAPGNYVVPVNQNSAHRGSASYRLDSAELASTIELVR